MAKNGFRVMDSDIHVMEPPELWERYLEPAYQDQAPRREPVTADTINSDLEVWHFAGRVFPAYIDDPRRRRLAEVRTARAADRHRADGRDRRREDDRRGDDPHSMLAAMDTEGVDVAIVFRTIASHFIAVDGLDPGLSVAMCRAFNDWLREFCDADPERLRPTAILPLQDLQLSVVEARRAVRDLGALALVLSNHPVGGRPWYDPYFDPLWHEAERLEVPVAFHGDPARLPGTPRTALRRQLRHGPRVRSPGRADAEPGVPAHGRRVRALRGAQGGGSRGELQLGAVVALGARRAGGEVRGSHAVSAHAPAERNVRGALLGGGGSGREGGRTRDRGPAATAIS